MAVNKIVYGGNTLIDLTGDTVTPENLISGVTAHNKTGVKITGTFVKPVISGTLDTSNNINLSGDIADGTYTVMFDSKVVGTFKKGVTYTNVLVSAVDCYGNIFYDTGYRDGYVLSISKKIDELFQTHWIDEVWNNFMECLNDNI